MALVNCSRSGLKPRWLSGLLLVLLFSSVGLSQDAQPDAEGCKDSPLVSRFPGSHISSCEHKDFDAVNIPVSKDADGATKEESIEGEVYTYEFAYAPDTSELQIYRNLLNAFQKAGYTVDFQESPYKLTVHRGIQYVSVNISGAAYTLYTIKQKSMEQSVTASSAEMRSEIDKSGHVAVYGIEFANGKAELLPASENVLQEVLRLLRENPGLRVRVEGHTDNTGSRDLNQKLSEERAAAVASWLEAKGIGKNRLSSQGFADTKPVADNDSEAGRAKNRRVELVKL